MSDEILSSFQGEVLNVQDKELDQLIVMCTKNINHLKCSHFQWDLIHVHIDNIFFRQCSNVQNKFINCKMSRSLRWFPFWSCTKVFSFFQDLWPFTSADEVSKGIFCTIKTCNCAGPKKCSVSVKINTILHSIVNCLISKILIHYFTQIFETFCLPSPWTLSRWICCYR